MASLSSARERLASVPTTAVDGALAALFAGLELWQLAALSEPGAAELIGVYVRPLTGLVALLLILAHIPLVWRQRAPLPVLVFTAATFFVATYGLDLFLAGWGLTATLYEVATRYDRHTSLLALAVIVIGVLVATQLTDADRTPIESLQGAVYLTAVFVSPWALGYWAQVRRERTARLERDRELGARRAIAGERARLARELHDILAHSISVMILQASGGREMLPAHPDRAAEALALIETTGRQSMVEVRRLLGVLRGSQDPPELGPQPGLERLDELVAQIRDAGTPVTVEVLGHRRPLDPSVDLSAYRIVQEALTNMLKHAGRARAVVTLTYAEDLRLEVRDDGRAGPWQQDRPSAGNGLLGMRERALLVGGSLEAGALPEGGFRVVATLPVAAGMGAPVPEGRVGA